MYDTRTKLEKEKAVLQLKADHKEKAALQPRLDYAVKVSIMIGAQEARRLCKGNCPGLY